MIIYYPKKKRIIEKIIETMISESEVVFERKYRHFNYYYKIGCGFDIETSKVNVNGTTLAICYHWQFSLNKLTVGGRKLSDMVEFFKFLDKVCDKKNARLLALDANLNYEFQFCKHYWERIGFVNDELFAKDKREPLRILVGKHIFMVEALGLFGKSLENVAENYCTIKKLKGDLDHDKIRNSETPLKKHEEQYCENDVQILSQLGNYIFRNFFSNMEKFPLTSISRLRNRIKKEAGKKLKIYKNEIQNWMPSEEDYSILRTYLFKGGICGTNSKYMDMELKNICMADYTSDYPAKCFHYAFPMGKCKRVEVNDENIMNAIRRSKPFIMKIEFHDLKSTTTHSLISSHKCLNSCEFNSQNCTIDNGRIFRAEKCILFLNDIELLSFGFFNDTDRSAYTFDRTKTKILQMWVFDRYDVLPDYVLNVIEDSYRKKAKLKKRLKKIDKGLEKVSFNELMNIKINYNDSKADVNGIFGMMCTALYQDELEYNGDIIDYVRDSDGKEIKKPYEQAISNLFLYPFWGFWITSYARMILIDTIIRFPSIIIQYDTDSIYFINDGSEESEKLLKYIEEFNAETMKTNREIFDNDEEFEDLGCWELNKENFKNFKGLGSKRYMYEDKKGVHITTSGCRSVNCVYYNGELLKETDFHILSKEKNLSEEEIKKVLETEERISTIEFQYRKEKPDMSLFEYFHDQLEVKEENANKLCSKYYELDDVIKIEPTLKTKVVDYDGNESEEELSSCVVLEPVGFKMGISETHKNLFRIVQRYAKNNKDFDIIDDEIMEEIVKRVLDV